MELFRSRRGSGRDSASRGFQASPPSSAGSGAASSLAETPAAGRAALPSVSAFLGRSSAQQCTSSGCSNSSSPSELAASTSIPPFRDFRSTWRTATSAKAAPEEASRAGTTRSGGHLLLLRRRRTSHTSSSASDSEESEDGDIDEASSSSVGAAESSPQLQPQQLWAPTAAPSRQVTPPATRRASTATPATTPATTSSTSGSASPAAETTTGKRSRYLREMDRRAILERLDRGEKQSALAKEFRVTRAAICNLNKHRALVLARGHEDPLAKHPKKSKKVRPANVRATAGVKKSAIAPRRKVEGGKSANPREAQAVETARSSAQSGSRGASQEHGSTLHEVPSRAAAHLFAQLSSEETPRPELRRFGFRLATMTIEEALVCAQLNTKTETPAMAQYDPLSVCGIALGPQGTLLLEAFRTLEPELPTGKIRLGLTRGVAKTATRPPSVEHSSRIRTLELPRRGLGSLYVLLLHGVTATANLSYVIESVSVLLDHGAVESQVAVATLAISRSSVAELQRRFPSLQLVVATMHSATGEAEELADQQLDRVAERVAQEFE